ncbi:MAG: CHAT domain-containing protein [Rhizobiales bacterium]|nr:CHAT domain-containing protein [Hyphomicrobiales bacterium]
MTKISVPGYILENDPEPDLGLLEQEGFTPKVIGTLQVDASRQAAEPAAIDDVDPDHLIELTLDGGYSWVTSVSELEAEFPHAVSRSRGSEDALQLPLHFGQTTLRGGARSGLRLRSAQVFDIDLDKILGELDVANLIGDQVGDKVGRHIAEWFDERNVSDENNGVRQVKIVDGENGKEARLERFDPKDLDVEKPILLLLHGTASTTQGSFGGLWNEQSSVWNDLHQFYGGQTLALEHRTLSVSPLQNALTALESLPQNAKLHLVSHSRGGMIGELICRAGLKDVPAFDEIDEEILTTKIKNDTARDEQMAAMGALKRALNEKTPTVERFVRVAAPAAGTTLASGKLDRWLSNLTNLAGKFGLDGFATYRFLRGFLLAVAKTRTKPQDIPGLQAMMPGSALTMILNRPDIETSSDLSIIAGDIEGEGLLHSAGVWLTDRFYGGDHDLVVDTASMYGGLRRSEGGARNYRDEGPEVFHFRYFKNEETAQQVLAGLRRKEGEQGGFSPFAPPALLKDMQAKRGGMPRPHLFLLPGILGSHLVIGDNRVWLDPVDIFMGKLEELDLHGTPAREVRAERPLDRTYADLAHHLNTKHDVEPFAYDWRKSLQTEAKRFAARLNDQLKASDQPVRILAHSMGGLVARLAFVLVPDVWDRFQARRGNRLVMLGTPSRGSFSIVRLLMAREKTTKMLALLDFRNSELDLLKFIRRFPGILELLPLDKHLDIFDAGTWQALKQADPKGWAVPEGSDLAVARETWQLLERAPVDGQRMVYVAGAAEATPIGVEFASGQNVHFIATAQGDGRVPWATGLLPDVPTYYVPASHGDLPSHEDAFRGYQELLERGSTNLISAIQPVSRGGAVPFEMVDDVAPMYPDAAALEAAAVGATGKKTEAKVKRVTVQVRLGDLAFSDYPVMIGHYSMDNLNGAERLLDRRLGGRLSDRHRLALYPGREGTCEVILDPDSDPPGAVVVGLGTVGELTLGKLTKALSLGLRRYGLTAKEEMAHFSAETHSSQIGKGLSTLIIGSGDGGLGMRNGLTALLDAIIHIQDTGALGSLEKVEIIELYEDRAIRAMRELAHISLRQRFADRIEFSRELHSGEGNIRRLVLDDDPSWLRRVEIKQIENTGAAKQPKGLRFANLTGRARIEDSVVADTLVLADAFIDAAVNQANLNAMSAGPGRTLFELLMPRRLKLRAEDKQGLVLMLDVFAAKYPWELLEDDNQEDGRPLAVRAGLIRQLHEERFREDVVTIAEQAALVVGDPKPEQKSRYFSALPGAEAEAHAVSGLLSRAGYAVDEEIRKRPTSVISKLMGHRYRILHMAAHGVFDQEIEGQRHTGLVLGDGLFLTPGAVNQLHSVPELVFLNCCFLGQIDPSVEEDAGARYHELAANLATQFIKIGAKAVIAAGWAVDDAAASTFARTFYGQMLDQNTNFIDAVRIAREQTYGAHPETNTWGAYQAYGDPNFRLNASGANKGGEQGKSWYQPYEAVLEFEAIAQRAQAAEGKDISWHVKNFNAIIEQIPEGWRKDTKILMSQARAAGTLGLLEDAISAYSDALAASNGRATIKAAEQKANLSCRLAVRIAKGRTTVAGTKPKDALNMVQSSLQDLKRLNTWLGPTVERLNLMGSAAKRASQISEDELNWLKEMAEYYKQAYELAEATKAHNPFYSLTNWLLANALIELRGGSADVVPDDEEKLVAAKRRAQISDGIRPSFWNYAARTDIELVQFVNQATDLLLPKKGRKSVSAKQMDESEAFIENWVAKIAKGYKKAWARGGSILKMNSIFEHLEFLRDALDDGQSKTAQERRIMIDAVQRIEDQLRAHIDQPGG